MKKEKYPFGEKLVQKLLLLSANDEYKKEMDKLLKKYNPPSDDGKIIDGKKELEFLQTPKSREMVKEYLKMIDKHGLSGLFDFMMKYIIENGHMAKIMQGENVNLDPDKITSYLISSSGIKVAKEKECLNLAIYPDTSIKDIERYWPEIKKAFDKKSIRKKGSKNLKRDIKIMEMKNKGLKAKEIASKINSDSELKNKKITYQEIPRIIKRLKTRAQKDAK